ncbi:hypothetical protein D9757_008651 [Collybiopsis confluens]|uniref:Carbonic anhydrase n=1 Tax=Collybiopsis confluens TaxID=2823264 RepID=A0A8H5H468_9AGAR|nr:hypothetical protein D9757_008651 [Collybiopsis confluens]
MSLNPVHMLIAQNAVWAASFEPQDSVAETPKVLWIGCSDSRVPESVITASEPGVIFVHRNIGNQVHLDDNNMLAVLAFAIEHLNVDYVVVCGHSDCGAVQASLDASPSVVPGETPVTFPNEASDAPLNVWHAPLTTLAASMPNVTLDDFTKANIQEQVNQLCSTDVIQNVWASGRNVCVYGLIYDLASRRLTDLEITRSAPKATSTSSLTSSSAFTLSPNGYAKISADWRHTLAPARGPSVKS